MYLTTRVRNYVTLSLFVALVHGSYSASLHYSVSAFVIGYEWALHSGPRKPLACVVDEVIVRLSQQWER